MTTNTDPSELNNWYETKLWRQIEQTAQPETESVRTTIREWIPKIQQILSVGGTSPTDFTLHDSQHAFRVAQLMEEIIPSDVFANLSVYELALLLFAAYLHDIGMTPTQSPMMLYHDYLLSGYQQSLSNEQISNFQRWLDEQGNGIVPPLSKDPPTPSILHQARFLVTNYCRAMHVELAEGWIDLNMGMQKLGSYAQWISDLKRLCRSHQQGYDQLMTESFDPKPVGSTGLIVHLRYLAIVLRIADILDFDPERTPEVIFKHRQISPSSIVYWHKDHHISRILEHGRLTISAEPPDARLHRAIELTIDSIEAELRLVRQIDDERPLEVARFQEVPLYHHWDIVPNIRRDIRPKNNAYEYIFGGFRPDTEKLLQLLSGKELYGDEMIAVRELLQNAFDAIREQIAYERLQKQYPNDPKWEELLGGIHEIKLRVQIEEDRIWLVCDDDGAGMSKSIISNYLLVSGIGRRPDVKLLERRCRSAGFEHSRTGQFGIGVLSYFMIADLVQIRTKRSALAEDADSTGWYFETEGIGSFGELRKDVEWRQGTEVRLRLRPDVIERLAQKYAEKLDIGKEQGTWHSYWRDARQFLEQKLDLMEVSDHHSTSAGPMIVERFYTQLQEYLKDTLCFLPCNFQVSLEIQDGRSENISNGWAKDRNDLTRGLEPIDLEPLSEEGRKWSDDDEDSFSSKFAEYKDLYQQISNSLTFSTTEGQLPGNLGTYRINIPVFTLSAGISPFFFNIIDSTDKDRILIHTSYDKEKGGHGYIMPCDLFMSWNGMKIDLDYRIEPTPVWIPFSKDKFAKNVNIEIDWRSNNAGTISVSRETLFLSQDGLDAIAWLKRQVVPAVETLVNDHSDSPFIALNLLTVGQQDKLAYNWLFRDSFYSDTTVFGVVKSPVIDISLLYTLNERDWMDLELKGKRIEWNGRLVHQILDLCVGSYRLANENIELAWSDIGPSPSRIVQVEWQRKRKFTPLWMNIESTDTTRLFDDVICEFPPEWQRFVGIKIEASTRHSGSPKTIWNRDFLVANIALDDEKWAKEIFKGYEDNDFDPRPYESVLLSSKSKSSVWLALVFRSPYTQGFWRSLIKNEQEFLIGIWQLLFGGLHNHQLKETELYFYDTFETDRRPHGVIDIISPTSYVRVTEQPKINRLLPVPNADWTLTIK